jgi:hypothetical protein
MKYPVLSLNPPYGTLVQILAKRNETRGRRLTYRGPLLIHQTLNPGPIGEEGLMELCRSEPFRSALIAAGYLGTPGLPRGAIIALVEVVDCLATAGQRSENGGGPKYADWVHDLSDQERAFGDYTPGRYALPMTNVRALPTPIPARGMPGLWYWEGELGL